MDTTDIKQGDTVKIKEKYAAPSAKDNKYEVAEVIGNAALLELTQHVYWVPLHQLEKVDPGDTPA